MPMMKDRGDADAIRRDLQRWRDTLKQDIDDQDTGRALRDLIDGAEKRLRELEEGHKV
jgi:hypothetical protein